MAQFQAKAFGEYYLLERIAVGGMAEIFKAKTYGVGGFEKLLAVKRILPHHAQNHEFISMLIDEAKIAVALNHINIVQVFDLGKIENDYFIAMEYVEGKDLRTVMRRCKQQNVPLTLENAVYIILEICKGLDYAHRKTDKGGKSLGVVHRDISPQNILISFEGEVKIVDFGIAKAANKVTETDAGVLKGKFSYMSPEQAKGLPVDRRTDIFSVGIITYELLTGEKLFPGENHTEILDKIRDFRLEHPFLPAQVPSELEFIVASALEPDLAERYPYASDFQVELTKYLYSSSLDFTARNLADLMKRLFQQELEQERRPEKVDVEIDEDTRSFMLRSHSESLVSKMDHAYDEAGETEDLIAPAKNRTIIQKFQSVLRRGTTPARPQPRIALKSVPRAALAPAPALAEEKTEPLVAPAPPAREPRSAPPPEISTHEGSTPPSGARSAGWLQTLSTMPAARKLAMLVALVGVLCLLLGLAVFLSGPEIEVGVEIETPPPQAQATPALAPTAVAAKPAVPDDLRRVNFNPQERYPRAAILHAESKPPGAEVHAVAGRLLGVTPLEIFNLPTQKSLEFKFTLPNYHEQEKLLTFQSGEEKRLTLTLEPHFGSIEVNSTPQGARVLLNKVFVGMTPLRYDKVFPETPTLLTMEKDGFEEYTLSFRLKPEEVRLFNKVLEEAVRALLVESSPPGAAILLNGASRGVTPRELTDLAPGGEYLLILRAPGYRDFVRKVRIDPDKGARVFAKMEVQNQKIGILFVESDPPGASIILNGQTLAQKTPAVLDQLRTDQVHTIKVALDDHESVEYRLRVDPEAITSRKAILNHLTGRLTVKSNPPNAIVLLNDRKIGETPIAYFAINSGVDFILTLKKEGYRDQIRKLKVAPNENLTLNFTLEATETSPESR